MDNFASKLLAVIALLLLITAGYYLIDSYKKEKEHLALIEKLQQEKAKTEIVYKEGKTDTVKIVKTIEKKIYIPVKTTSEIDTTVIVTNDNIDGAVRVYTDSSLFLNVDWDIECKSYEITRIDTIIKPIPYKVIEYKRDWKELAFAYTGGLISAFILYLSVK